MVPKALAKVHLGFSLSASAQVPGKLTLSHIFTEINLYGKEGQRGQSS